MQDMTRDEVRLNQNMTTDGILVRYIYSACIVTSSPDLSILHDPWFTEGIYDGSWYHYPKVNDPLNSIGNVDYIYVSHIHPDHYDSRFIHRYFEKYGVKKVLISNHEPNYLAGKMRADGIEPTILNKPLLIGCTEIQIIPHITGSISDIDSALIIKYKKQNKIHCVVNANDIVFDEKMTNIVKDSAGDVDILLCGFTGAGPYPQTYFDISDQELYFEAERKKKSFFERYKLLTTTLDSKVNIPFAGKYILGGALAYLNSFRGVADPVEVLEIDRKSIVLSDNGGEINTLNLVPSNTRTKKYDDLDIERRLGEIKNLKMDYERLIAEDEIKQLPLKRLLVSAARNAIKKSECDENYFFCFNLNNGQYAIVNANKNAQDLITFVDGTSSLPSPHSQIFIDPRYLFGLLTHIYHWNNAEVGSQYNTRRKPNEFNKKAQAFLNYLAC
jgi:UDP-MurNAc hydroxylase